MIRNLSFFVILINLIVSCQAPRPKDLGSKIVEGKSTLSKCPDSPNCIGSHYQLDVDHHLDPLKYETTKENAKKLLLSILNRTDNAKVITNDSDYIHVEFTSSIFKFVDDVEFNFQEENLIHFRSASRTGHSDLGANKKRMETITFRFYQNDM
jgi:uncharacterized protein (DUF1499 family)